MNGDPRTMQNHTPYTGSNNVVGNGAILPIDHNGNIRLKLGSSSFYLRNVILINAMCKNLLSIAQFAKDNNVLFAFNHKFFYILDLITVALLFRTYVEMVIFHFVLFAHFRML